MEDMAHVVPPVQLDGILRLTEESKFSMASEPLVGALLRVLSASKPKDAF